MKAIKYVRKATRYLQGKQLGTADREELERALTNFSAAIERATAAEQASLTAWTEAGCPEDWSSLH